MESTCKTFQFDHLFMFLMCSTWAYHGAQLSYHSLIVYSGQVLPWKEIGRFCPPMEQGCFWFLKRIIEDKIQLERYLKKKKKPSKSDGVLVNQDTNSNKHREKC